MNERMTKEPRRWNPSDYVSVFYEDTGEMIEVAPDFFVNETRERVKITDEGMGLLNYICRMFLDGEYSPSDVVSTFLNISDYFGTLQVADKLNAEFIKLIENN